MNRIFTVAVTRRRRTEDEKPRRNGQGFVNLGDHLLPGALKRAEENSLLLELSGNSRMPHAKDDVALAPIMVPFNCLHGDTRR